MKTKIKTFGRFCELLATEPENVYSGSAVGLCIQNTDTLGVCRAKELFDQFSYFHQPVKKKRRLGLFMVWDDGDPSYEVEVYENREGIAYTLCKNNELATAYEHYKLILDIGELDD